MKKIPDSTAHIQEPLPKNFPVRQVSVKNWGEFIVPRHIVRIDSYPANDRAETHGWQVRYKGTKFFSDSLTTNPERTPRSALQLAIAHLAQRYTGQAVPICEKELAHKTPKNGTAGVRVLYRLNKRDFEEVWVEVGSPDRTSPKRFYVGTANTATQKRLEEVMAKAREFRVAQVRQHLERRRRESMEMGIFLRTSSRL